MMTEREAQLEQALARSLAAIERLELENKLLREKLDRLIRRIFGAKSEKLDEAQLLLLLQGLDEAPKKPESPAIPALADDGAKNKNKRAPRKPVFPDNLPVQETILDPVEVQAAPSEFRCIGAESSDQYDYEPPKFFVRRTTRRKFVRLAAPHKAPIIAPLPEKIKDRHKAGPGLLAALITGKYCDHLPLYRQQGIFQSRHGVYLPRQTMSLWLDDAADWFQIIYGRVRNGVFDGGYVQMDETHVQFLDPGNGKSIKGYLWGCNRPGGDVFYDWSSGGRGMDRLDELVPENYAGKTQSDGYSAYDGHASRNPGRIVHLYCWAHVRRKFFDAAKERCRKAAIVVYLIDRLYDVERDLRAAKAGPALREARRASSSMMVSNRIFALLERWKTKGFMLPSSATSQAIEYTLKRREGLEMCLADGMVEIDNNLMENSLRPIALGRKNWLFFGSREAGQKSAVLFTIIENCRRQGIDPFTYLRDVFENVGIITNQNAGDWTPAGWASRNDLASAARKSS